MEFTESTKKICPLCGEHHTIDKYDWIDSCIGYYWIENFKEEVRKKLEIL